MPIRWLHYLRYRIYSSNEYIYIYEICIYIYIYMKWKSDAHRQFLLSCNFKFAVGNRFLDSLSPLSESNHRHTSSVSFILFSFSFATVTRSSNRLHKRWPPNPNFCKRFWFYACPGWPKFAWVQLFSRWETRQMSNKSHQQERPCLFLNSTVPTRHVHVLFGPRGIYNRFGWISRIS